MVNTGRAVGSRDRQESLAVALAALEHGRWDTARAAFEQSLEHGAEPIALDGLGRALWWLADLDGAVAVRSRAFSAYLAAGDVTSAARIAWWLVREYSSVLGNPAAAGGWLTRCRRMLDGAPPGPAHGWLALARSLRSTGIAGRLQHARTAYDIARSFSDPDLEMYALAAQGLYAIAAGHVDSGTADLDEVVTAAADATHIETLGDILCTAVQAAEMVGDPERFKQWNQVLEAYMSRHHHVPLHAFCFTCCGEVSAGAGEWEEADRWYTDAIGELERSGHRSRCAHPVSRLAHLRIRQGRLTDAEHLLAQYPDLPETVEPRATLLLAQGRAGAASQVLSRQLDRLGEATLPAVPLLSLLAQARAAESDPHGAHQAADKLARMAELTGLDRVRGMAALAAGRLAREQGQTSEAAARIEGALAAFERAGLPMEVATAHRELARVWAENDPELAIEEARLARQGFIRLGARRESDEATAVLRSLGVRGQTGPKQVGTLSQREREVLQLVAEGLTNAEIAARLFISAKTAGNHVSNVLMKLGVRSRTEAAAVALRHPELP